MDKKSGGEWISLSDMMTGLMLVFLLIAVVFMMEVQKREEYKNRILIEYNNSKQEILKELKKAFEEKQKEWDMTIDDQLVIKFNNDDILFESNKADIKPEFRIILDQFIPIYFSKVLDPRFKDKIVEVSIEGHAGGNACTSYLRCLPISHERANSILIYIFSSEYFANLSDNDKKHIEFILSSSGLSRGKNVDKNGQYIYNTHEPRHDNLSRRVEFHIKTNSEEIAQELLNKIQ